MNDPSDLVRLLADIIESREHQALCDPFCLCGELVKIPAVGAELERRLRERDADA